MPEKSGRTSTQAPSSVGPKALQESLFPFDAFSMDKEGENPRGLWLVPGWVLGRSLDVSASKALEDDDGYSQIFATTGASNLTLTLPTAAANKGRVLLAMKADSGAGKLILDGEGAELVNGFSTMEFWYQGHFIVLRCDGTGWLRIGGTNSVTFPVADRYALLTNFTTVGTSWNDSSCSGYVPVGAKSVDLNAMVRLIGDGTTDTLTVWFATSGSPAKARPLPFVVAEHANIGAGLYTKQQVVFSMPVTSALAFQHSDLVLSSGAGTGRLDLDIAGYSYE